MKKMIVVASENPRSSQKFKMLHLGRWQRYFKNYFCYHNFSVSITYVKTSKIHDQWLQGVFDYKWIASQVFQSVIVVWLPLVVATHVHLKTAVFSCVTDHVKHFALLVRSVFRNLFWLAPSSDKQISIATLPMPSTHIITIFQCILL